jgi:hypothetical protein
MPRDENKMTVEAWAEIVIKEWVKMAETLNIHPDDKITVARFQKFLTVQGDGDVERIKFTFDYYLKFVDWGVGKGVNVNDRQSLVLSGVTKRQPKMWYGKVFPKQMYILGHLLAERYGYSTAAMIKNSLESKNLNSV